MCFFVQFFFFLTKLTLWGRKPNRMDKKQIYLFPAARLRVSSLSWTCMWHQVRVPISSQEVEFFPFFTPQIHLICKRRGKSPATNSPPAPLSSCPLLLLFLGFPLLLRLLSFPPSLSSLHRSPVLCDAKFTLSATGNWFHLHSRSALIPIPLSSSQRNRQLRLHTAYIWGAKWILRSYI